MTLNDLRAKRNVLEFKLGGLIKQFEDETGLEVDAKIHYERCWSDRDRPNDPPTPCCELTIELGYGDSET